MIEHRPWLVLLCLPLWAAAGGAILAEGLTDPPDDFLTIWQTFSDAARQTALVESLNANPTSAGLSPGESTPRLFTDPTAGAVFAPNPIATSLGNDAPAGGLWDQPDKKPRKVSQKSDGLLGSLNARVEVTDAPVANIWDEPSWKRTWKTDDSWQMGVAGPLSVFGQVGANSDEAGQSNMKVSGRTGVSCKVPFGSLAEFTLRSGPGVSYTDPLHPVRTQGRPIGCSKCKPVGPCCTESVWNIRAAPCLP